MINSWTGFATSNRRVKPLPMGMASFSIPTVTGRMDIASVGSMSKIVRSTHGVNCTGSCSWKSYVKNGLVTWETQQTDYPRTRPDLPNHEPRGCPRGASYSWVSLQCQPPEIPG